MFNPGRKWADELRFIFAVLITLLVFFAVLRGLLLWRNFSLASEIPWQDLLRSFVVGLKFDLNIAGYIILPLVFALILFGGLGQRYLARLWLFVITAAVLFAGVAELDFYYEFHNRLNSIVTQYLQEDPATVSSMLWNGFPVLRYLFLWLLLLLAFVSVINYLHRKTAGLWRMKTPPAWPSRIIVSLIMLLLLAIGIRGKISSGPPLQWGDGFHSRYLFANHLALNGTFTLIKAIRDSGHSDKSREWREKLPAEQAQELSRALLLQAGDQPLFQENAPILRRHTPAYSDTPLPIRNIVLIIMESFSSKYVGAQGNNWNITPEFDRISREGLLFTRFFSSGTHTHQGMFASVACFPNVPGFEYLMQQPLGQNQFSGLPVLLKPEGFEDLYVYNGIFSWDNQEGFFRNQGMTRFVGRDDFVKPTFFDPTWGVSDQDMFDRSILELSKMDTRKPFFAVLQTLSNHTPYNLPDPLPFERISGRGEDSDHLTAMKYADWALGRFFDQAKQLPMYKETLFILVGDHGFGAGRQISDVDLLRHHVPMLLIAPGIQERYGRTNDVVSSQPDIVPTAVSLLGKPFTHQCWGRDLLSLPEQDPGFAMIKPSGSDQTVAMVQGSMIAVKSPGLAPKLGRYQLGEDADYIESDDIARKQSMTDSLFAYIQLAINALYSGSTGIPEGQ